MFKIITKSSLFDALVAARSMKTLSSICRCDALNHYSVSIYTIDDLNRISVEAINRFASDSYNVRALNRNLRKCSIFVVATANEIRSSIVRDYTNVDRREACEDDLRVFAITFTKHTIRVDHYLVDVRRVVSHASIDKTMTVKHELRKRLRINNTRVYHQRKHDLHQIVEDAYNDLLRAHIHYT